MPTFLFDEIVFGPVRSRRLGVSLGINLSPVNSKLCNFDCVYCEVNRDVPPREQRLDVEAMAAELEVEIKADLGGDHEQRSNCRQPDWPCRDPGRGSNSPIY